MDAVTADLDWPLGLPVHVEQELALGVSERLRNQGYCLVNLPLGADAAAEALARAALAANCSPLAAEIAESYLGTGAPCKTSWLVGGPESPAEAFSWRGGRADGAEHVLTMAHALAALPGILDFAAWDRCAGLLLRVPAATAEDGKPRHDVLEHSQAIQHLDFLRRRRLCLMHCLAGAGGRIRLHAAAGDGRAVDLQLARGQLLVFRHDWFTYAYEPRGGVDAVLQTWLLEEPPLLRVDGLEGEREALVSASVAGLAPPQAADRHVHIASCACRLPGNGLDLSAAWDVWSQQVDAFTEMPRSRWDVDVYYTEDAAQFGAGGKSSTKHAAMLALEDLMCFDNKFFGISDTQATMLPPTTRLLHEVSYEAFFDAGYDRGSLMGANIAMTIADLGMEWDPYAGFFSADPLSTFPVDADLWAISSCMHSINSAGQVAHNLGICGPVKIIDTACSASLVAGSMNHASLRRADRDFNDAWSAGHQAILNPTVFIGLSAAGMLGRGGRCLTFDQTANGYNRGEGVGGVFQRVSSDPASVENRLGNYVSSFVNQDGRSASLTAPNGPSQQAVIRSSLNLENIEPSDLSATENHGTGTALGDPIEVGSIRAVFRKHDRALPVTTGKTHMGHLEGTAGSLALIKVLMSLIHAANPANVHLNQLNAHIDTAGFPGLFPTEFMDLGAPAALAGLNGFGFGGTNCRSELWGVCLKGPRSISTRTLHQRQAGKQPWEARDRGTLLDAADCVVEPCPRCLTPMCWRCSAALPTDALQGKHRCECIREETASYDLCSNCYTGDYLHGEAPLLSSGPDDRAVYLVGSWSSWTAMEEMRMQPGGIYVGEVRMGDTGFEQFHLVVEEDRDQCIFPVGVKASSGARVVGPLPEWRNKNWMLDGRADKAPEGTMYEVRFEWTETSKAISWRRLSRRMRTSPYMHAYSLVGSLTDWTPVDMRPEGTGTNREWVFSGSVGPTGLADLHFLRDGDPAQAVVPLRAGTWLDSTVPVVGPGVADAMKAWHVEAPPHSELVARLRVRGGELAVELRAGGGCAVGWSSRATTARDCYQVIGTFCDWNLDAAEHLVPSQPSDPGVLTGRFHIGDTGREEFQIIVNQNWCQVFHPSSTSVPGQGFLVGPEEADRESHWEIYGEPGQLIEVVLNFGAEDNRQIVTCRACDHEGAAFAGLLDHGEGVME